MRRLIGTLSRIVLVAVAAILIGGSLAAPAGANQRPEATEANHFIDFCFRSGGDPVVSTYSDGQVIVACTNLPGTGTYICSFVGTTRDCWIKAPTPGGNLPTLEPGDLSNLEQVAEESAPVSPPAAAAPADNQDDKQVNEVKKKKKQAKKGKKGKKGKAKQRGKGRGGR